MKTRFTLVIRPDGQALLTTTERLSAEQMLHLAPVLEGWSEGRYPIAVVAECDVVQVREVTIDLEPQPLPSAADLVAAGCPPEAAWNIARSREPAQPRRLGGENGHEPAGPPPADGE